MVSDSIITGKGSYCKVLILVLMEYGLGQTPVRARIELKES